MCVCVCVIELLDGFDNPYENLRFGAVVVVVSLFIQITYTDQYHKVFTSQSQYMLLAFDTKCPLNLNRVEVRKRQRIFQCK